MRNTKNLRLSDQGIGESTIEYLNKRKELGQSGESRWTLAVEEAEFMDSMGMWWFRENV